ncbi:hypothetical protein QTP86_004221 [Hemibagrus guttatus]|nr:hypothetical protein QTP86_004221 [Hemibagrus guttatus]
MVWLSTRNLRLKLPCRKLSPKFVGPFEIIRQVNPVSYQLRHHTASAPPSTYPFSSQRTLQAVGRRPVLSRPLHWTLRGPRPIRCMLFWTPDGSGRGSSIWWTGRGTGPRSALGWMRLTSWTRHYLRTSTVTTRANPLHDRGNPVFVFCLTLDIPVSGLRTLDCFLTSLLSLPYRIILPIVCFPGYELSTCPRLRFTSPSPSPALRMDPAATASGGPPLQLCISDSQGTGEEFFLRIVDREGPWLSQGKGEIGVTVRIDERVQEATEEGEIEWRLRRGPLKAWAGPETNSGPGYSELK